MWHAQFNILVLKFISDKETNLLMYRFKFKLREINLIRRQILPMNLSRNSIPSENYCKNF